MELLQIATAYFTTKFDGELLHTLYFDSFFFYKVQHVLLQIAMIITKGNSTEAPHFVLAIGWLVLALQLEQTTNNSNPFLKNKII